MPDYKISDIPVVATALDGATLFEVEQGAVSKKVTEEVIAGYVLDFNVAVKAIKALTPAADKVPYFDSTTTAAFLTRDIDGSLAANSDLVLATQKAVKTYVDAAVSGMADVDTDEVFTSDTSSTADSDPGNGLYRWNNATQGSATALYFDNLTTPGVILATFFASLPADGYIHLAQQDDATKWQLWKWSGLPTAAAGYYKFTSLALMASGGSLATAKATAVSFKGVPPSTYPVFISPLHFGVTTASELLGIWAAPAGVSLTTFAAALAGSAGKSLIAATAQTDIDVRKNATTPGNGTSVGTVRWAAAGTVPSFIAAAGFTATGGSDYLTFWGPATPDATLANFAFTLFATRPA